MNHTLRILAAAPLGAALGTHATAQGPASPRADHFRPIASYNVAGINAEIVDAANQGNLLVYTDAGAQKLGFVDITNPQQPVEVTTLTMPGEPVSVSCVGNFAYAAVWVDLPTVGNLPPQFLPGKLMVIDLANPANPTIVGSIDIGVVGETPPEFAQAAGADQEYFGNEPPAPRAEKILVPKDSPNRTLADLKGKRVVLNRGSNVQYLLVRALESANLKYTDVAVAYLPPADARAAFERGSVDAWVIWDPFGAAAEAQVDARILADGTGIANNYNFYIAARPFAQKHPQVLASALEAINETGEWVGRDWVVREGLKAGERVAVDNRLNPTERYVLCSVCGGPKPRDGSFHDCNNGRRPL